MFLMSANSCLICITYIATHLHASIARHAFKVKFQYLVNACTEDLHMQNNNYNIIIAQNELNLFIIILYSSKCSRDNS